MPIKRKVELIPDNYPHLFLGFCGYPIHKLRPQAATMLLHLVISISSDPELEELAHKAVSYLVRKGEAATSEFDRLFGCCLSELKLVRTKELRS